MARYIHWKATVVLNVLFSLALLNSYAQSPSLRSNISYSCRSERLGSVIEYLSKTSGYDFIYSRDLVDISKTVSLNVKNKSINEVLALIEKQLDVSFKIKDHHVIVKTVVKAAVPVKTMTIPVIAKTPDTLLLSSISRSIPIKFEDHAALLRSQLDKRISDVQKLFGPGVPKNIPPYYISQINFNNRHKSWFLGAGTYVGDSNSGLEIQAGLPYLYAVFHPHISFEHGFYASYGVGTSMNMIGNFSVNAIYMFSSQTKSETTSINSRLNMSAPEISRTQLIHQHQVKLAVQYAFTKNIALRAGPVLNYRSTTTEITFLQPFAQEVYPTYSYGAASENQYYSVSLRRMRQFETWIGWEASIQYRLNFFNRK